MQEVFQRCRLIQNQNKLENIWLYFWLLEICLVAKIAGCQDSKQRWADSLRTAGCQLKTTSTGRVSFTEGPTLGFTSDHTTTANGTSKSLHSSPPSTSGPKNGSLVEGGNLFLVAGDLKRYAPYVSARKTGRNYSYA